MKEEMLLIVKKNDGNEDDIECRRCATCHTPLELFDIGVWLCPSCNTTSGYMYLGKSRKTKIKIVVI